MLNSVGEYINNGVAAEKEWNSSRLAWINITLACLLVSVCVFPCWDKSCFGMIFDDEF